MKYIKIFPIALLAAGLAGCADTEIKDYQVEKPESITTYEYLSAYGNLKDYIDRSAHPNFHLGTGVGAADYNKKNVAYRVTNSNFDEITLGNAMKYASCVTDEGVMDFGTVKETLTTAEEAGISVFGHTLAWHSQQQPKWLNNLIADREIEFDPDAVEPTIDYRIDYADYGSFPFFAMDYSPEFKDGVMHTANPGGWYQYFAGDNVPTKEGTKYIITVRAKASEEVAFNVNFGDWGSSNSGSLKIGTDWGEYSVEIIAPVNSCFVIFQPGTAQAEVDYEWLTVGHKEAPAVKVEYEDWYLDYSTVDKFPYYVMGYEPEWVNGVMHTSNPGGWYQYFAGDHVPTIEGKDYRVTVYAKASEKVSFNVNMGDWGGASSGNLTIGTDWAEYYVDIASVPVSSCFVIFQPGTAQAEVDYKWIKVSHFESSNMVSLTPEEKKEVLSAEMERWIAGMMEACDGRVKAWDVVNEAISGADHDGDGYYDLQSMEHEADANCFYWQDYLGSDDYTRIAVKYARQYFAEYGGNPSDLKLFVNDYNLESDWDDNKKLKSLVHWMEVWESDGETVIDGIASQMHISYYENPDIQASKEDHIVKMLEIMANTGKLVKISELDMGYVDADGNSLKNGELTFEQEKKMAEYYKFIIEKYFQIIPANQQYGITVWCQTDAPDNSGWRGGEPVGLWYQNYSRKPVYAGIAEALD